MSTDAGGVSASNDGLGHNGFAYCWLVEMFDRGGNSLGRYHTGFTDLHAQSRSTDTVHEARRYRTRGAAERSARKLNTFMMVCEWRAVEHGSAAA